MFLNTLVQHSARKAELNLPLDDLFEDSIEMMAAAMVTPPCR